MKILRSIFLVLIICSFGLSGLWFGYRMGAAENKGNRIPSISELQVLIGAEPDGIIGPETLRKWEKALCDQYSQPYFETMKK